MLHSHGIVWMDHREAHVFRFSPDDVEKKRLFANNPFAKVHHKAGEIGAGHVHLDHRYFDEIADALQGVEEWLLTGPSNARTELASYLERHRSDLKGKLLANEAADHPTDGELLDRARRTFKRLDRMRPNAPPAGRS